MVKGKEDKLKRNWLVLHHSINSIFNNNNNNERKYEYDLCYEQMYKAGYFFILNKYGASLYSAIGSAMKAQIDNICERIGEQMPAILLSRGEAACLEYLTQEWSYYKTAIKTLSDVFSYVDSAYIEEEASHLSHLFENGVSLFRGVLLDLSLGDKIRDHFINLVNIQRRGNPIDIKLMKSTCGMMEDLHVYETVLEVAILSDARNYFQNLANGSSSSYNCSEYLILVETKLNEERTRANNYLRPSSKCKLEGIVLEEMITNQMIFLLGSERDGMVNMIQNDLFEDLRRMFVLFSYQESHLKQLVSQFEQYIGRTGTEHVSSELSPVQYIEGLIGQKKKYDNIVVKSFDSQKRFSSAVDSGFELFCNGMVQQRTAEYLSIYIHNVMNTAGGVNSEVNKEENLDNCMKLFIYLKDKDIFEEYYKIYLSKRLLHARGGPDLETLELEKSFLGKLKAESGYSFTSKIEGMFTDVCMSTETSSNFVHHAAYAEKSTDIDFHAHVLTLSYWPWWPANDTILPPELEQCCTAFTKYYSDLHTGRQLTWKKNMGEGTMMAHFSSNSYELHVTTLQIVILSQFNDRLSYSYQELKDSTQMPEKDLKRNLLLLSLGKHKILLKRRISKDVKSEDIFSVNEEFQCPVLRIRLHNLQKTGL